MRNKKQALRDFRYVLYAYLILLAVMFILPFYSADTYSIVKNTTSHLGAQQSPNAWLMNMSFILAGIACVLEAWLHLGKFRLQEFLLSIFGLGLILTGIFRHAPIMVGVVFNAAEDKLHSLFATIVGFSFTAFTISAVFTEKAAKQRVIDVSVGVTVMILSMLMFYFPAYAGIWQRGIFIISFTWLVFLLERMRRLACWENKR